MIALASGGSDMLARSSRGTFSKNRFVVCRYFSSTIKKIDHYAALGLNRDATAADIKNAYYTLSKEYHPDKNPDEEAVQKFQAISDAYEVLGNYDAKRNYDRTLIRKTPVGPIRPRDASTEPDDAGKPFHFWEMPDQGDYTQFFRARREGFRPRLAKEGEPPIDRTETFDYKEYYKSHYASPGKSTAERTSRGLSGPVYRNPERFFQMVVLMILVMGATVLLGPDQLSTYTPDRIKRALDSDYSKSEKQAADSRRAS